jgi:molybdenum cofactor guanylyltransferase
VASDFVTGIFVGGRATRMHGEPKGLLRPPGSDEPIVVRLARLVREVTGGSALLVGEHAAYRELGLQVLPDAAGEPGPLNGLLALLEFAETAGAERALVLACDLPFVDRALLERIVKLPQDADALAPRLEFWEPLFACYRVTPSLAAAQRAHASGRRGLYRVLETLGERAHVLEVTPEERAKLRDWDSPADMPPVV